MTEHWQQLVANFAVTALFISAWVHAQVVVHRRPKLWRVVGFGLTMGAGAVATMLLAIRLDGALFDLRMSLIATAGFFGGPLAALIAGAMALIYRVGFIGGPTIWIAIGSTIASAAFGSALWWWRGSRRPRAYDAVLLAAGVLALAWSVTALVNLMGATTINAIALPLALLNSTAALFSSLFLIRHSNIERERDLLRAAFLQSPDVQYIKTPDSRFAAVNGVLAKSGGYDDPEDLTGKTDFDLLQRESAAAIVADDRDIVETGEPKIDFEEIVVTPGGDTLWYQTSKVPLRDSQGEIIGLAGWTRDVTRQKRLEGEVVESRNELNYVLTEMTDGIAMFDAQGTLTYCNARYSSMFPLTSAVRRPGQHIRDILREVVATGEQRGAKPGKEDQWIDKIAGALHRVSDEEVELLNGSWLSIKTRPTRDGSSLVVVSDITTIKEADSALKAMTEQLKLLATTDGLTGLANRRAFDQALDAEMARSRRTKAPLTLLLIDVDRFKAYNDLYGHQEGDKVLRAVAQCLAGSMLRPMDVAARYGGEEFVAILPGTDEDGAYFVADGFRETLRGMNIAHKGSEKQVVTASVGIAIFDARDAGITAEGLIRRADEALYNAKTAGRDRVIGWRLRREPDGGRATGA
jgi:diguanylate cyclase (GGDEF)-like protein/PAS domain S-box-containing protein